MKHLIPAGFLLFAGLMVATTAAAQARPLPGGDVSMIYEKLLKQIDRIPIYDNHSHATFSDDSDMDAMAGPPDESSVLRLRGGIERCRLGCESVLERVAGRSPLAFQGFGAV